MFCSVWPIGDISATTHPVLEKFKWTRGHCQLPSCCQHRSGFHLPVLTHLKELYTKFRVSAATPEAEDVQGAVKLRHGANFQKIGSTLRWKPGCWYLQQVADTAGQKRSRVSGQIPSERLPGLRCRASVG